MKPAIALMYIGDIASKITDGKLAQAARLSQELSDYLYNQNHKELLKSKQNAIDVYAEEGFLHVIINGRDCDNMETSSLVVIRATAEAYEALEERTAENAEGPYNLYMISLLEAKAFKPSQIDHAAIAAGY